MVSKVALVKTDKGGLEAYQRALGLLCGIEDLDGKNIMKAVECSGSLLATIPKAFRKAAEIRSRRMLKLKMLLDNLE